MDDEQIKKIIDGPDVFDYGKGNYLSMVREFFSRRMRLIAIIFFVHFFFFLALAILSGILFLEADQTKNQIMYAAFFVCSILIAYAAKIFTWVTGNGCVIKREIKRLELRIAELNETVKNK
jgi:uncharacterized membrane protein